MAVTFPVPSFLVSLSLCRLDITVPTAIIIDITPAYEIGALNSLYIVGQAAPNNASGRPRLINDIYMIANSKLNISYPSILSIAARYLDINRKKSIYHA